MPRTKKKDKFFYKLPKKSGEWKNKILIGINIDYEHYNELTLEDLVIFLKEKNITLKSIKVPNIPFISIVRKPLEESKKS